MMQVVSPGFYTSIQDRGRKAYRHLGVPISGPMDQRAFDWANALLPYPANECQLECTMTGPHLILEKTVRFVLTGASIEAELDAMPLQMNKVYVAEAGASLRLGKMYEGLRSYVRFQADIKVNSVLGSQSFFYPITPNRQLKKGDLIPYSVKEFEHTLAHVQVKTDASYLMHNQLDWIPGPDWMILPAELQKQLLFESHRVLAQNRMGYRLSGSVPFSASQLLSQVVLPGMVQLTPSGQLLIATADCQVTGGYLQILQLTRKSLNVLVQKQEGSILTFQSKPLQMAP